MVPCPATATKIRASENETKRNHGDFIIDPGGEIGPARNSPPVFSVGKPWFFNVRQIDLKTMLRKLVTDSKRDSATVSKGLHNIA